MSRRILGMRTSNWTQISNSRPSRTSTRLDRGEYDWQIVIFDRADKRKSDRVIRADSFDDAVKKATGLIQYGERVTVDGRSFTKQEFTMKTYLFTITLQGSGETPEEAWAEAVEAFDQDPGEPHAIEEVEEEEE